MRTCKVCKAEKEYSDFYQGRLTCRKCVNEAAREKRRKIPTKTLKPHVRRELNQEGKSICSRCREIMDISEFTRFRNGRLNCYCHKCNKKKRQRVRLYIEQIKVERGCEICGLKDECPAVFDFHHKDDKDSAVSDMIYKSKEDINKEVAKCMVVCANCHRRLHYHKR